MKKLLFLPLMFFLTQISFSQDITGPWNGLLDVMGTELTIVFNISESDDGLTATLDSPDQGAFGIPVSSVSFEDNKLTMEISGIAASYEGTLADGVITGNYMQSGATFELNLTQEELEKKEVVRPQVPEEPYPYYTEEVTFENTAAGVTLAGTLTLPDAEGVYPVVVLISGSGPQNRDEELLDHRPFLILADHLTRNGIGVLRYDDRGTAESTGNFSAATSEDFAQDAMSAVSYLKTRKDINHDKIGLAGHSEGGLIAPMVAVESPDVAFIALLAGPGMNGAEIIIAQSELISRAAGTDEELLARDIEATRHVMDLILEDSDDYDLVDSLNRYLINEMRENPDPRIPEGLDIETLAAQQVGQLTSTWMLYFLRYDPVPTLEKVKCPVLAINGELDLQVPAVDNLNAIAKALEQGGNENVTVQMLPGLNHLFQECETGSPDEYGKIEQTFSPVALNVISNWILEQVE